MKERDEGFRRILLATDGSADAESAVELVIELAEYSPAKVRVLHVWSLETHHRHGHEDAEARGEADRLVGRTVARLTDAGVDADSELFRADPGHVAAAIALVAREFEADLIVAGSRGLSDWQSIFRHSIGHAVLAAVDCPVLVVRKQPAGAQRSRRKILVAVAGGPDIPPAVHAVAALPFAKTASVTVLHVTQAFQQPGHAFVESEEETEATLKTAVERLHHVGVDAAATVAPSGPVAATVSDFANRWGADLIVIGSSRMGDLASMVLGSVSHELLHSTQVPVLVSERER
jgi:nucleotide-binding universal stress UspA family protein